MEHATAAVKTDSCATPSDLKPQALKHSLLAKAPFPDIFPQGCQFSPDGLCILTAQSHALVLFNTHLDAQKTSWKPALKYAGGDSIRSYEWYPHMNSADPPTCCFLGAARDQPAHLYDAYTGATRATYRPYNALDEMESPAALCFASNGQQIVAGGFRTDRMLHVFDLNRPGREPVVVLKLGKTRRSKDGQKGLVSALSVSSQNLLAVGTYSPGSIYLYDLRAQSTPVSEIVITGTCVVGHGKAHSRKRKHFTDPDAQDDAFSFSAAKVQWYHSRARSGITQLEYSDDSNFLFSASRKSNAVLQWDLRRLASSTFCPGIASYATHNDTNQRLGFALHDDQLWIGGQDKCVRVYNQTSGVMTARLEGFQDAVNGVSVSHVGGKTLLATSTGSRRFPSVSELDMDEPSWSSETKDNGWLDLHDVSMFSSGDYARVSKVN